MAWTDWPPVHGVSPRKRYKWARQLWEAVRERQWMFNDITIWPGTNIVWHGGTITSITDNADGTWTIYDDDLLPGGAEPDDGRYWNGNKRPGLMGCGSQYWVGLDCTNARHLPSNYDVIIQTDDGTEEWYRNQQPWNCVRSNLVASTSQTLKVSVKLQNYVVAKCIPADPATSLVGKRYYIIKTGGLWWADQDFNLGRYPDWPNHEELWRGVVTEGKFYDDGTGWIRETTNKIRRSPYEMTADDPTDWLRLNRAFVTPVVSEVLWYDTDGWLHRSGNDSMPALTGNGADTLFFGGLTYVPTPEQEVENGLTTTHTATGNFSVVPPGSRGLPGRKPWNTDWWYGGVQENVYIHRDRDDGIGTAHFSFAAGNIAYEESEDDTETPCEESIHTVTDAMDAEVRTSEFNICESSGADRFFSPQLPKTLRYIQNGLLSLIGQCVQAKDHTGATVTYHNTPDRPDGMLPVYSIARCFYDCGINAGTGTISGAVSGANTIYTFTVADVYKGVTVYWEAKKDGIRKAYGSGTADATTGKVTVATVVTIGGDHTWNAQDVVYSAGFTRKKRYGVRHFYEQIGFMPDTKTVDGSEEIIYPPVVDDFCCENDPEPPAECCKNCAGVGTWMWWPVSSGYKTYNTYGFATDETNTLIADTNVRYEGDGWLDPGTGDTRLAGIAGSTRTADSIVDLDYWHHARYEGQHPLVMQESLRSLRGPWVISAVQSRSVTLRGPGGLVPDFYFNWYTPHGVMRIESGVATDGTSTTLTLEADLTDDASERKCWWAATRYLGDIFDGKPYKSFILEIDHVNEDDSVTTYKVQIDDVTAFAVGTGPIVLHFQSVNDVNGDPVVFAAADAYRIVEPATNLHRFRGRRMRVALADGTFKEIAIAGNDVDTFFFDEDLPPSVVVTLGVTIVEYEPGGIWTLKTTEPSDAHKDAGLGWQKISWKVGATTVTRYWVQPTPGDNDTTRATGQGKPWRADMTENLANLHDKTFGLILKGDSIGLHLYDEAYRVLNRLVWTQAASAWTSRHVAATPEDNAKTVGGDWLDMDAINTPSEAWNDIPGAGPPGQAYPTGWSVDEQLAYSGWTPFENDGEIPQFLVTEYLQYQAGGVGLSIGGSGTAVYGYGKQTGVPSLIKCTIDWLSFGTVSNADPDEADAHTDFGDYQYYNVVKFDGHGESEILFRKWALFDTTGPAKLATRVSDDHLGEVAISTGDIDPPSHMTDGAGTWEDKQVGWYAKHAVGVRKWNCDGGLRYTDWTI